MLSVLRILVATGLVLSLVLVDAAGAETPATTRVGTLQQVLSDYQRQSGITVAMLQQESVDALLSGDTVYRKLEVEQQDANGKSRTALRIVGYRLIGKPRESLWLSALGVDTGFSERLTEHFVRTHKEGGASWYQHLNMPWPLKDRHWLVRSNKNVDIANATNNRIWEHHWQLVPDARNKIASLYDNGPVAGIKPEKAADAVLLPLNQGAWMMAAVSDTETLVVVHATVVLGGIVPDGMVARQTRKNLIRMLTKIEEDADSVWTRYDASYQIFRGDGTLIPPRISRQPNG
ncbi:MAG: hypothetical protein AAGF46_02995 [Pseudomonadota bacterium]